MLKSACVTSVMQACKIRFLLPSASTRRTISSPGNGDIGPELDIENRTPQIAFKGNFKRNAPFQKVENQSTGSKSVTMKGNFKRTSQWTNRKGIYGHSDSDKDRHSTYRKHGKTFSGNLSDEDDISSPRDLLFKDDMKHLNTVSNHNSLPDRDVFEDEQDRRMVAFKNWKSMVTKYRESQRTPNFLTWEVKERIKMLHANDPSNWTFERLSAAYPVSVLAVKQIIKNKWSPRSILDHDSAAIKNWNAFKEGRIPVADDRLRAHLLSFMSKDEVKNFPQIEGFDGLQESEPPVRSNKLKTIDVHKEKLGNSLTTFESTPNNSDSVSYQMKINIPKHKFKDGATYRIKDCYYHSDGIFLYRVPGMDEAH